MTFSPTIQAHFKPADVGHRHTGTYSTLDIGSEGNGRLALFFRSPDEVDAVIAELVALRADMTGDDAYRLTAKGEARLDAEAAPAPGAEPVDCGFTWRGDDGLMHGCVRPPHGPEYDHEVFTSDGTRLTHPAAPEGDGPREAQTASAAS